MTACWRTVAVRTAAIAGTTVMLTAGCGSAHPHAAAPPSTGSGRAVQAGSTTSGAATEGSGSASPQPSVTASGAAACAASGLRVSLDLAAAGVAGGTSYVPLQFANTTQQSCQLTGFPAVAFTTGASGQQIGTEAAVDRAVPTRPVLLTPGGVAHAWLEVQDAADYPARSCHPVTAAGLRVVVPGAQNASYLAHPVPTCKGVVHGGTILTVQPVQAGKARRGTA